MDKVVHCCLCVEELVVAKFSVLQESHHDPFLGWLKQEAWEQNQQQAGA